MDNFELIEKYILGKMTDSEKSEFEQRLKSEPDLHAEKEILQDLILGVETHGLKEKLKSKTIGESHQTKESNGIAQQSTDKVIPIQKKSPFSFRSLAIAASFAGFLVCGWWLMNQSSNSTDQLYSEAFYTDPGLPTPMSESKNYNFYDAMVDYKMENYDAALTKWKNVKEGIGLDTLDYYTGIALLEVGKSEEARVKLKSIAINSDLYDKANWYLLSSFIREKNYSEAKKLIKIIPPTINPKYEEIKLLLETK